MPLLFRPLVSLYYIILLLLLLLIWYYYWSYLSDRGYNLIINFIEFSNLIYFNPYTLYEIFKLKCIIRYGNILISIFIWFFAVFIYFELEIIFYLNLQQNFMIFICRGFFKTQNNSEIILILFHDVLNVFFMGTFEGSSLSELTPIVFNMELTHLCSEVFIFHLGYYSMQCH